MRRAAAARRWHAARSTASDLEEARMATMLETHRDAKQWGMFVHLAAFAGYVSLVGWVLGPLIVWLIKKDQHRFVDDQGKEALNFQVNMLVYMGVAFVLSFLVIGIPLLFLLGIANIVLTVVATVQASKGRYYRYPLVLFRPFD